MGTKNFDNALDLVTFSRASGGTYLDSDGLIKTAATNVPRVEYDASGNWKGLLIEEARTNLVTRSNDFSNAAWVKGGVTITPNNAISPDGNTNASYLNFTSTGYAQTAVARTIGQTYTVSAWVKSYDGTDESFQLYAQNGTFTQGFTATSEWQRFYFTYTATTAGGDGDGIARPSNNIPALLHLYGFQIEAGAFPTSYIPTTGATATRAADICSIATSAFGYNKRKYSLLLEAINLAPDNDQGTGNNINALTQFGDSTNYSSLGIGSTSSRVNRPSLASRSNGGAAVFAGDLSTLDKTFDEGLSVKFAASFDVDGGTIAGSVNGSTVFSGTGVVAGEGLPFTSLNFQKGQGAAYIKSIRYYPRRLSNAQLQALTA